jgi:anti-sigma B factor antagonist
MDLRAEDQGECRVIHVNSSRIDAASAIQFKDGVRDLADDGPARVVLNLEKVAFIDSSGLGAVVAAMKLLGGGRKMELAALTGTVDKVFRLTRMDTIFRIHKSLEAATSPLTQPQ